MTSKTLSLLACPFFTTDFSWDPNKTLQQVDLRFVFAFLCFFRGTGFRNEYLIKRGSYKQTHPLHVIFGSIWGDIFPDLSKTMWPPTRVRKLKMSMQKQSPKARTESGPRSANIWTEVGPSLGPDWTELGPSLGPDWTEDGPKLDQRWTEVVPKHTICDCFCFLLGQRFVNIFGPNSVQLRSNLGQTWSHIWVQL